MIFRASNRLNIDVAVRYFTPARFAISEIDLVNVSLPSSDAISASATETANADDTSLVASETSRIVLTILFSIHSHGRSLHGLLPRPLFGLLCSLESLGSIVGFKIAGCFPAEGCNRRFLFVGYIRRNLSNSSFGNNRCRRQRFGRSSPLAINL